MSTTQQSVEILQNFFMQITASAPPPRLSKIIYPLLGYIVLNMDKSAKIGFKEKEPGNHVGMIPLKNACSILALRVAGFSYVFIYEHDRDYIIVNKRQGEPWVSKINNLTTHKELVAIFPNWQISFGVLPKEGCKDTAGDKNL